jgi:hypothetical protein
VGQRVGSANCWFFIQHVGGRAQESGRAWGSLCRHTFSGQRQEATRTWVMYRTFAHHNLLLCSGAESTCRPGHHVCPPVVQADRCDSSLACGE